MELAKTLIGTTVPQHREGVVVERPKSPQSGDGRSITHERSKDLPRVAFTVQAHVHSSERFNRSEVLRSQFHAEAKEPLCLHGERLVVRPMCVQEMRL